MINKSHNTTFIDTAMFFNNVSSVNLRTGLNYREATLIKKILKRNEME